MPLKATVNENARHAVELLIKLTQISRAAVADATGIKRPNLVGWLNKRNGISEERVGAVMRTLHIPGGKLDGHWVHRWAVSSWEEVRDLLDLLLAPEEKQNLEIFHVGRETEKPVAILRCDATVDGGGEHPPIEVFFMIILTPAPLAPPLGLLNDMHLGCGVVRAKEPDLELADLSEIEPIPLMKALFHTYPVDYPAEEVSSIFDDFGLREQDETLESELYATVKRAGRENTRFMLGIAARQPDAVRALQLAKKSGYSEEQIRGWIELLTSKPEFSRVLVEALLTDSQ